MDEKTAGYFQTFLRQRSKTSKTILGIISTPLIRPIKRKPEPVTRFQERTVVYLSKPEVSGVQSKVVESVMHTATVSAETVSSNEKTFSFYNKNGSEKNDSASIQNRKNKPLSFFWLIKDGNENATINLTEMAEYGSGALPLMYDTDLREGFFSGMELSSSFPFYDFEPSYSIYENLSVLGLNISENQTLQNPPNENLELRSAVARDSHQLLSILFFKPQVETTPFSFMKTSASDSESLTSSPEWIRKSSTAYHSSLQTPGFFSPSYGTLLSGFHIHPTSAFSTVETSRPIAPRDDHTPDPALLLFVQNHPIKESLKLQISSVMYPIHNFISSTDLTVFALSAFNDKSVHIDNIPFIQSTPVLPSQTFTVKDGKDTFTKKSKSKILVSESLGPNTQSFHSHISNILPSIWHKSEFYEPVNNGRSSSVVPHELTMTENIENLPDELFSSPEQDFTLVTMNSHTPSHAREIKSNEGYKVEQSSSLSDSELSNIHQFSKTLENPFFSNKDFSLLVGLDLLSPSVAVPVPRNKSSLSTNSTELNINTLVLGTPLQFPKDIEKVFTPDYNYSRFPPTFHEELKTLEKNVSKPLWQQIEDISTSLRDDPFHAIDEVPTDLYNVTNVLYDRYRITSGSMSGMDNINLAFPSSKQMLTEGIHKGTADSKHTESLENNSNFSQLRSSLLITKTSKVYLEPSEAYDLPFDIPPMSSAIFMSHSGSYMLEDDYSLKIQNSDHFQEPSLVFTSPTPPLSLMFSKPSTDLHRSTVVSQSMGTTYESEVEHKSDGFGTSQTQEELSHEILMALAATSITFHSEPQDSNGVNRSFSSEGEDSWTYFVHNTSSENQTSTLKPFSAQPAMQNGSANVEIISGDDNLQFWDDGGSQPIIFTEVENTTPSDLILDPPARESNALITLSGATSNTLNTGIYEFTTSDNWISTKHDHFTLCPCQNESDIVCDCGPKTDKNGLYYRISFVIYDNQHLANEQDVENAVAAWLNQTFENWTHTVYVANVSIQPQSTSRSKRSTASYICNVLLIQIYKNDTVLLETTIQIRIMNNKESLRQDLKVDQLSVIQIENCKKEEYPPSYKWPESRPTVVQYLPCFHNKSQNASRTCLLNLMNYTSFWGPMELSNCISGDIDSLSVSAENAAEIATQLKDITNNELTTDQVNKIVSKLKELISVAQINESLATTVVEVFSNVLSSPDEALAHSSDVALKTVDELAMKILFTGPSIAITSKNLALGISALNQSTFNGTAFSAGSPMRSDELQVNFERDHQNALAEVVLPPSLLLNMNEGLLDTISRIQFAFFTKTGLFQDQNKNKLSLVVATSVGNVSIKNLKDPVMIVIQHTQKQINSTFKPFCVFWDFKANDGSGGWNGDGCRVGPESNGNSTVCLCDHLTHFGVLMDISGAAPQIDARNTKILTFISYIGCGISAIFSAATLLTYLAFEKLRRDYPSKILMNLSTALLFLNMFFLLDGWLASFRIDGFCIAVAAFLHFFLLTSFTWMGLEAVHMYIALVKVFNTYIRRYILKFCIVGWGLPAITVTIVVAIDRNFYGKQFYGKDENTGEYSEFCWIKSKVVFYITCVAYFGIVFLLNVAMFIVVMVQICGRNGKRTNRTMREEVLRNLRSVVSLTFLLGMTWGFAFFAWGPVHLAFTYLFAIFNSLQGLFIFIFHCALKENVQKQWRRYLCCGRFRLAENSDWSKTATNTKKVSSDNLGKSLSSSSFGSSSANWQAKSSFNPFARRKGQGHVDQRKSKCGQQEADQTSIIPVHQVIDKVKGYCSVRSDNFYKNIFMSDSFSHSTKF
ncbi:adhesion G-protein coupled receptor G6 isoform X2 [Erpetoichthys calabaricus]|uniref:adhesion G-protein coupled receptor G6 isoform X2 n=1 Tax=Erpetoichthys calabaricus TaxID=27687 RepID=UPI0022343EE2|nr:adhesion G-protein coupled receptor G6 isoform X2 [Erpetoichthys calabaricus]